MLTTDDKDEIKRLVGEAIAGLRPSFSEDAQYTHSLVDVTARAIEVFGTREKAMRWLRTPVRALGNQTPMSLLRTPEGLVRVQDTLGQVEHGVW